MRYILKEKLEGPCDILGPENREFLEESYGRN